MANLTSAALIRRTDDNDGAPLFCLMNELEQWDKVENASGSKNQFTNLKIDDDEFNTFGAERAGTQSVTAATSLHLNWIASTTPGKAVHVSRWPPYLTLESVPQLLSSVTTMTAMTLLSSPSSTI